MDDELIRNRRAVIAAFKKITVEEMEHERLVGLVMEKLPHAYLTREGIDTEAKARTIIDLCHAHFTQEVERLQAELAECQEELFIIKRSIIDPENQPSQFGTVTLDMYEALQAQLAAKQDDQVLKQKLSDAMGANWENRYSGARVAVEVCCDHFEQRMGKLERALNLLEAK